MPRRATVFAPGSIGNVGPGFDVLGLAVDGGMGGSAASSVAGALAAARAMGEDPSPSALMEAALAGEAAVAGRHLDNIAASVLGGLTLVRTTEPLDAVRIPLHDEWWVALVTPEVRVETRAARALLPETWGRAEWVQQMANTAALVHAFATGDRELVRRSLDDRYAEPRRASLIPRFAEVKGAALASGGLGCSISGSGPTVFALAADSAAARRCASAMKAAFADTPASVHVGRVAEEGARERP